MNDQWQNKLRDRMAHHEESAPEGLWDRIDQIMSDDSVVKSVPVKRNMIPLWSLRIGGIAAAVLVLLFIGWHALHINEYHEDKQMAEQVQIEQVQIEQVENKQVENELAYNEHIQKEYVKLLPPKKGGELVMEQHQQPKEAYNPSERELPAPPGEEQEQDSPSNDLPQLAAQHHLAVQHRQNKRPRWETGLYASNLSLGAESNHVGYGSFNTHEFPSENEEYVISAIRSELPEGTSILNEYEHVYTNVEHHQPITVGATFRYNLDERWSLTSGLVYTILSSKLQSGTDNHYYNSRQTLHYVGIPLNVNYTLWRNDKVFTYVSGGGMVEKNVSGKLSTDFVIDNQVESQTRQKISVKPLQWSVNSTIGIQYQLYKNIGVYAEPGVAYHFKNNSYVETIYKEKPFNFNISMGLRFTLNE